MEISVVESHKNIRMGSLTDKTAIVVDAMRSAATIITAVHNGCDRIIPVSSVNDVLELKHASEGEILSCGEISAVLIPDFDLGNSPADYTEERIKEKILIFSTTNGSIAIKTCDAAATTLIGSFLNASAVASYALMEGRDIALVCAGTKGKFSTDDILACGCIIDKILKHSQGVKLDDFAYVAYTLYMQNKEDMSTLLANCKHYVDLVNCGAGSDIEYCLREDIYSEVPVYKEGVIFK